jgi:CheY-like chemotaxis protein
MNDFGGNRILVVEPDSWTRVLLLELFRSEGCEVDSAFNLAGAVACADGFKPQVLVTNYLLEDGMTGQNLALALRQINQVLGLVFLSKLPELALASPGDAELLAGAKYHSAGDGFSVDRLLAVVSAMLPGAPSK